MGMPKTRPMRKPVAGAESRAVTGGGPGGDARSEACEGWGSCAIAAILTEATCALHDYDTLGPLQLCVEDSRSRGYQTEHRSSGARTMASPALQPKALQNSGKFESGPMTRYLLTGCGFVSTNWRCASGRISSPRACPQDMKNCCSGVKPSWSAGRGLPSIDFSKAR